MFGVLWCAVQGVVAEADDVDYWFHASKDGNREKHYRYCSTFPLSGMLLMSACTHGNAGRVMASVCSWLVCAGVLSTYGRAKMLQHHHRYGMTA